MRHPRINLRDLWVAQTWIVVAGVDDRDILRDSIKQVLRKFGLSFAKTASAVVLSGYNAFIPVMETTYLRDFDNSPSA